MTPFRKGMLIGVLIGFAGTIVLVVGSFAVLGFVVSSMMNEGGGPPIPLRSAEFPDGEQLAVYGSADWDWTLRGPDGEELSLQAFRGKPVLLNVWATWCPPCRAEMPSLDLLAASAAEAEFAVVVVSDEDADTVRAYAEQQGLALTLYTAETPPPEVFSSRGIPATFIIDPEGLIVFKHVGAADWNADACRDFLRSLAGQVAG